MFNNYNCTFFVILPRWDVLCLFTQTLEVDYQCEESLKIVDDDKKKNSSEGETENRMQSKFSAMLKML